MEAWGELAAGPDCLRDSWGPEPLGGWPGGFVTLARIRSEELLTVKWKKNPSLEKHIHVLARVRGTAVALPVSLCLSGGNTSRIGLSPNSLSVAPASPCAPLKTRAGCAAEQGHCPFAEGPEPVERLCPGGAHVRLVPGERPRGDVAEDQEPGSL